MRGRGWNAQQVVCFVDNIAQSAKGRLVMGASLAPEQPSAGPPFLLNLLFSKVILFVCLFLAVLGFITALACLPL